ADDQSPGSAQPPPTAFWPASHVTVKLADWRGLSVHGPVLTTTRPAAVLAGPGISPAWLAACDAACEAACWTSAAELCGPSFFAVSATSACLALSAFSARF